MQLDSTMHFTSETTSFGVRERTFTLGEITGVLWSPEVPTVGAPLLLSGHSGGMHKKAPGLVAGAFHHVTRYGFTVAAIDAPGHGDRPRTARDQRWVDALEQARSAGQPIGPIVTDVNWSLAQRAVPEWRTTLDALQALPEIGTTAPVGYGGLNLGVATGILLAPVESRITAVSFGAVFVDDNLLGAAQQVTVGLQYRIPWDDEYFDRAAGLALFDAFGSSDKTLHAHSGSLREVPAYERDGAGRFFAHQLGVVDLASD